MADGLDLLGGRFFGGKKGALLLFEFGDLRIDLGFDVGAVSKETSKAEKQKNGGFLE